MKILIADDDPFFRTVLHGALESIGHQVSAAGDGDEAWSILEREPHRIVITDWMMPGLSGVDLCSRIRQQEWPEYIYVMLLSAKDGRDDRLEGLDSGADDFLTKPLDKSELIARLNIAARLLNMEELLRRRALKLEERFREQKEQNEILADAVSNHSNSTNDFLRFFEKIPVATYICDSGARITHWNEAAEKLFGYSEAQAKGRPVADVFDCKNDREQEINVSQILHDVRQTFVGANTSAIEIQHLTPDGRFLTVSRYMVPLWSTDHSKVRGAIIINTDQSGRPDPRGHAESALWAAPIDRPATGKTLMTWDGR